MADALAAVIAAVADGVSPSAVATSAGLIPPPSAPSVAPAVAPVASPACSACLLSPCVTEDACGAVRKQASLASDAAPSTVDPIALHYLSASGFIVTHINDVRVHTQRPPALVAALHMEGMQVARVDTVSVDAISTPAAASLLRPSAAQAAADSVLRAHARAWRAHFEGRGTGAAPLEPPLPCSPDGDWAPARHRCHRPTEWRDEMAQSDLCDTLEGAHFFAQRIASDAPLPPSSLSPVNTGCMTVEARRAQHAYWLVTTGAALAATTEGVTWLDAVQHMQQALLRAASFYLHIDEEAALAHLDDPLLANLVAFAGAARGLFADARADGKSRDDRSVALRIVSAVAADPRLHRDGAAPPTDHDARAGSSDRAFEPMARVDFRPHANDTPAMIALARASGALADAPASLTDDLCPGATEGHKERLLLAPFLLHHSRSHGCADARLCADAIAIWHIATNCPLPLRPDGDTGAALAEAAATRTAHPPAPGTTEEAQLHTQIEGLLQSGVIAQVAAGATPTIVDAGIFCVAKLATAMDADSAAATAAALGGDVTALRAATDAEAQLVWSGEGLHSPGGIMAALTAAHGGVAKLRLVYDGRRASPLLADLPHRMPSLSHLGRRIRRDGWLFTLDLAGGFHHVVMAASARPYLRFKWRDKLYEWQRLPFGIKQSSFFFCFFTSALGDMLRAAGIDVICVYVDDIIMIADTEEAAAAALDLARTILRALGVAVAEAKTRGPAQRITLLGLRVDTVAMHITLPEERLYHIHLDLAILATVPVGTWVPSEWVQTLVGRLSWLASIARHLMPWMGPAWYLRALTEGHHMVDPARTTGLLHFIQRMRSYVGVRGTSLRGGALLPPPTVGSAHTIASDAAGTGLFGNGVGAFGAIRDGVAVWARFTRAMASAASSTTLELYAALAAAVQLMQAGDTVMVVTDSSATAASLNSGAAAASRAHRRFLRAYHHLAYELGASFAVCHQPRELLTACDELSNAATIDDARHAMLSWCDRRKVAPITVLHAPVFTVDDEGVVTITHKCASVDCDDAAHCEHPVAGRTPEAGGL